MRPSPLPVLSSARRRTPPTQLPAKEKALARSHEERHLKVAQKRPQLDRILPPPYFVAHPGHPLERHKTQRNCNARTHKEIAGSAQAARLASKRNALPHSYRSAQRICVTHAGTERSDAEPVVVFTLCPASALTKAHKSTVCTTASQQQIRRLCAHGKVPPLVGTNDVEIAF